MKRSTGIPRLDAIIKEMKRLGDEHRFPPDFNERTLEKMAAIRPFGVPVEEWAAAQAKRQAPVKARRVTSRKHRAE